MRYAGRDGVGALCRMVETFRPHGCHITQSALHLVGKRERCQHLPTITVCVFCGSQNGSEIVAGMTGLTRGKIAVIEIEIANQSSVA